MKQWIVAEVNRRAAAADVREAELEEEDAKAALAAHDERAADMDKQKAEAAKTIGQRFRSDARYRKIERAEAEHAKARPAIEKRVRVAEKEAEIRRKRLVSRGQRVTGLNEGFLRGSHDRFVKHMVGASAALGTLSAGVMALAITSANRFGTMTQPLAWAFFFGLATLSLALVFHGIPFFSHLADWYRYMFTDISHDTKAGAIQRGHIIQVIQLLLVFLQLILWVTAVVALSVGILGD